MDGYDLEIHDDLQSDLEQYTRKMTSLTKLKMPEKALESYDALAKILWGIISTPQKSETSKPHELEQMSDKFLAYINIFYVACTIHILETRRRTPGFPRKELETQFQQHANDIESCLKRVDSIIVNMTKRLSDHPDSFTYLLTLKKQQESLSHLTGNNEHFKKVWIAFKQRMQPAPIKTDTATTVGKAQDTDSKSGVSSETLSRKRKTPAGAGDNGGDSSETEQSNGARSRYSFHKKIKTTHHKETKDNTRGTGLGKTS